MEVLELSTLPERLVEAAETPLASTSGIGTFPATDTELASTQHGQLQSLFGGSSALILQAMAAVFLLSCVAAYLTYLRLSRLEQKRREKVTAGRLFRLPAVATSKQAVVSKVSPIADASPAEAASRSAPETPEQLYTPKQVRSSSHDLSEVRAQSWCDTAGAKLRESMSQNRLGDPAMYKAGLFLGPGCSALKDLSW